MEAKTDSDNVVIRQLCLEARLTPAQCNEIIEDKLTHLLPVMECALVTFKSVNDRLANGEISWRKLLGKAKEAVEDL